MENLVQAVVLNNLRIKNLHHANARARRRNNVLRPGKNLQKTLSQLDRFLMITGVKSRLPAAGLIHRVVHYGSNLPQNLDEIQTDTGEELIRQAGNKKRDFHEQVRSAVFKFEASPSRFWRISKVARILVICVVVNAILV